MLPVVRTDLKLIDIYNSLIDSLQKDNKPLEVFERKLQSKEPQIRKSLQILLK